ncbi:unnamed protein product [Rotaria magnacalcarata]
MGVRRKNQHSVPHPHSLIVPLLCRMINLEELQLYLVVARFGASIETLDLFVKHNHVTMNFEYYSVDYIH